MFRCTDTGLLAGRNVSLSSLLLSLLLEATDVDGLLELEKYDLTSILLSKAWPVSVKQPKLTDFNNI